MNIATVVVSFNRKVLLKKCLQGLGRQTLAPNQIWVVDNASTDGTREWLSSWLPDNLPTAKLVMLENNLGGAGGFKTGMQAALNRDAEWIWMMDDDAEPHPDALEQLMRVARNPDDIYGSLAVNGSDTSWLTTVCEPPLGEVESSNDVPAEAGVQSLPFLGFLIHRALIDRIGLPDAGFFIAADDVEYCIRGQRAGARIMIAGHSRIEHPKSRPYKVRIMGTTLTCLALPPWKRYYDTRNRILIAKKYYGLQLFTQTIPGSVVRLVSAMVKEPEKLAQLKAWSCGMLDGLFGIKGMRHIFWRIK